MEPIKEMKYGRAYYDEIVKAEGAERAERIMRDADSRCEALMRDNSALPEKIKAHTDKMIFPAIAVYRTLLEEDPGRAMEIMETAEGRVSAETGTSYAKLVGLPFMRRVFLRIFSKGTKSGFSEESGFITRFIRDDKDDIAFDIEKCPYCDFCAANGCPELTHIFCRNDNNAYGALPGIVFERHETLGAGGRKCDFHLYLKK